MHFRKGKEYTDGYSPFGYLNQLRKHIIWNEYANSECTYIHICIKTYIHEYKTEPTILILIHLF